MSDIAAIIWSVTGFIGVCSAAVYVFRRPGTSISVKHKDTEIAIGIVEPKALQPVSSPAQTIASEQLALPAWRPMATPS